MIKTTLNLDLITNSMKLLGLNQAKIADVLSVSKESVSQWLSGDSFPRARHLLKLGELLNLSYSDLVREEADKNEPVFAFSIAHNYEHTEEDLQKVTEIGYSLEKIISYFEINTFKFRLTSPLNNNEYIKKTVEEIKGKYGIKSARIGLNDLNLIFNGNAAYIVPVLWGNINNKSNGLHIYLPESNTNWIYINLDSFIYDFKFWLLHEFAHLLTPDFNPAEEAEEFANHFAAEFLFPIGQAKDFYEKISTFDIEKIKVNLFKKAIDLLISPYTIYKQINRYLVSVNKPEYDIPEIVDSFKKSLPGNHNITVTKHLLNTDEPTPEEYLNLINENFNPSFINALDKYYLTGQLSIGFIKNIFHISLQDAQNILSVIKARKLTNSVVAN
jgi:transcriptional regulator with XRE-family HTH domain